VPSHRDHPVEYHCHCIVAVMTIGSIGPLPFIPPNQAAVERLSELAAPPTFRRPDISNLSRQGQGQRLQQRPIIPSAIRSIALKKLLEDAVGTSDLPEQLATLEKHLRGGGELNALLDSGDPLQSTLLYLLASDLAAKTKSRDSAFASYVEAEIAALLASKGEEINAAVNSAKAFADSAVLPADRRWLRTGYLAVVSNQAGIPELLESLLVRFGPNGFEAGANVLLKGINDDLASASPSIRPGKLHLLLLSSLVALRHLTSFIHATLIFSKTHKGAVQCEANDERLPDETSADIAITAIGHPSDDTSKEKNRRSARERAMQSTDEEALTVKTFMQLIAGQGSIKLIQRYLEEHFCQHLDRSQSERIYKDFMAFVRDLPLALWRERSHKDKLLDALRKQLLADQLDRLSTK
jgi:type III secretion system YopN/LcrE/InvE/MxiC family regulator